MPKFWGCDINEGALAATRALLQHNHCDENETALVESNLFAAIEASQKFDVIVFNPPYVATDEEELSEA